MTEATGMSPNGKYAVGVNIEPVEWGLDQIRGFRSFVWDMETGTSEWLTYLDAEDYSKSGYFSDINDSRVVCGWFKDPQKQKTITEMGATFTLPLNVAAVWDEGGVVSLGTGDIDESLFTNFNDGSYATAISNDSKTVVGFVATGNMAVMCPCAWVKNEATGKYDYVKYSLPDNASLGVIEDVSGDGSVAAGYVRRFDPLYGALNVACYWTAPDECHLLTSSGIKTENGACYAVSNNGKYIAFTYDEREPSLYVPGEDKVIKCGRHENVTGLQIASVTDDGDVFGFYKYGSYMGGDMSNRPFWYSYKSRAMTDFDYFVKFWANDVEMPYKFSYEAKESAAITAVSAGGDIILGCGDNRAFAIATKAKSVLLPLTVETLKAVITGEGEVTITATLPDNSQRFVAKELVVYRDGNSIITIPVGEDKTISYADKGVAAGTRYYTASVIYKDMENGGKDIESPRSKTISIQVETDFSLPLYDNFDSGSLGSNHWSVVKDYGETDYQSIGCPMYSGLKSTCALYSTVFQMMPYSYSAVSRHINAAGESSVYASFARKWEYVNSTDWPLDKDTVSLEVSVDGEKWVVAKDMLLNETPIGWSFEYVDLTPFVAGKLFQVRFRMHGQAAAQYLFCVDEFKIDVKPEREGMQDVLGATDADGNFRLAWKNSLDAYPLTYLANPYYNCYNLAVGDEGRPIIAANMFTKEDLGMYKGKYLTSVTVMVNHDEYLGTIDTHTAIVVYEDGKLVREQEFVPDYNTDHIVKLEEPLLIDGTKELKIGLKVYDYDARQLPLAYYNSYGYVEGKSDLYSEDGGNTWKKLSDLWAGLDNEADGFACWQITGNVTDRADANVPDRLDLDRFAAEVYKNGEKLSERFVYLLEPGYTDKNSLPNDTYNVRVFYTDGTCTELSNTVKNSGSTGIGDVAAGYTAEEAYTVDGGKLDVNGSNKKVEIYNSNGVKVYDGGGRNIGLGVFGHGMFLLKVYAADGSSTVHKIMF